MHTNFTMKDFTRALHSTRKRIRIQELFKLKCSVSFHSTTDRPQIKLHTLFKFTIAFHFGKKLKRIVCFDEIFSKFQLHQQLCLSCFPTNYSTRECDQPCHVKSWREVFPSNSIGPRMACHWDHPGLTE